MTGNGDRCLAQVCRFADHHNSKTCRGLQRFEPKQDFFNTIGVRTDVRMPWGLGETSVTGTSASYSVSWRRYPIVRLPASCSCLRSASG